MRKRQPQLSIDDAVKRIQSWSLDSGKVIITDHAEERMEERGVTLPEVLGVLRRGYIDDPPVEEFAGHWKCKVTRKVREREVGVVTVIVEGDGTLIVVTVEWEDNR